MSKENRYFLGGFVLILLALAFSIYSSLQRSGSPEANLVWSIGFILFIPGLFLFYLSGKEYTKESEDLLGRHRVLLNELLLDHKKLPAWGTNEWFQLHDKYVNMDNECRERFSKEFIKILPELVSVFETMSRC